MLDSDLPLAELTDAYRKWRETKGANVDEVLGLMADEIEMRSVLEPNDLPHELARAHRSREEAKAYFQSLLDDWEMIDFPQEKIVADGDTVVWIGRCSWRNKHDGKEIDTPKIDVWTFRNGKAVSFFEMFDSLGFAKAASLL
jgi:ketosteroid isomerase-like protein